MSLPLTAARDLSGARHRLAYFNTTVFPSVFLLFGGSNPGLALRLMHGELSLRETAMRICFTGFYCSGYYVFDSLRRVTAPAGQLDQLGAGTVQISAKARAALRRWSATFSAVTVLLGAAMVYLNLPLLISGASHQGRHDATNFPAYNRFVAFGNMMLVLTLLPSIFGFYFSLKIGSRVANARVKVAAAKVKEWPMSEKEALEPDAEEELWRTSVVEPTFALAETTLPTLSDGWGRGIGFMALGSWLLVAACLLAVVFDPTCE